MSRRRIGTALAIAALALAGLLRLRAGPNDAGPAPAAPASAPVARVEDAAAEPAALAADLERAEREAALPAPAVAAVPLDTADTAQPLGRLVVRAFDPSPLGALLSFDVRLASATRFAHECVGGLAAEATLPLTPGTYAVHVESRGYEPVEIEGVLVASGQTHRLAPIALPPGSGSLRCDLAGDAAPGATCTVELIGDGRRPCGRCGDGAGDASVEFRARLEATWKREEPCPACGFARDRSRLALYPGTACTFANLASGPYAVRLGDAHGAPLAEARPIRLTAGERAAVVLEHPATRSVELEVFDPEGRSLSAEWSRRLAAEPLEPEVVEFVVGAAETLRFVCFDDASEVARAVFEPPLPHGAGTSIGVGFGGRRLGGSLRNPGAVTERGVDRERIATDLLRPEPPEPRFEPAVISCSIALSGLLTLGPLGTARLRLEAATGSTFGGVDLPETRATTRVEVRLGPR